MYVDYITYMQMLFAGADSQNNAKCNLMPQFVVNSLGLRQILK